MNVEWVLTKNGDEPVLEIRYDINELHTNMTEDEITEREPAYLLLNTSGTHATPISLHNTPPEGLFIKGEVRSAVWQRYLK